MTVVVLPLLVLGLVFGVLAFRGAMHRDRWVGYLAAATLIPWAAFRYGLWDYDTHSCTEESTDCDLGILTGLAMASVALGAVLVVCVVVEIRVRRLRAPGERADA